MISQKTLYKEVSEIVIHSLLLLASSKSNAAITWPQTAFPASVDLTVAAQVHGDVRQPYYTWLAHQLS